MGAALPWNIVRGFPLLLEAVSWPLFHCINKYIVFQNKISETPGKGKQNTNVTMAKGFLRWQPLE